MKITKIKNENPVEAITFRLPTALLNELTKLAKKNGVSRQKLVSAILQTAIDDKSFKLVLEC